MGTPQKKVKPKGAVKRKAAPPRKPPSGPGLVESARGWARALVRSALIGGVLGGGIVGAALYRQALATVDGRLDGGVPWSVPGRVWSAPIEVRPGLAYAPDDLAADLSAAGYARVAKATQPGDFQVAGDAIAVVGKPMKGPGWSVEGGETLVTFAGGEVRSVTPKGRARFGPAALAVVRGPDNENRSPVPLERIPKSVRDAVLAMEDARFYDHPGIDAVGIARAVWTDLLARDMVAGGSTLTQQVAKNLFLTHERTARRKLREALIALALEERLSKDEILQLYLNEIYLGQVGGSAICGVDAAARAFFGKPIERVTLGEAATIAGIISSPNPYSPIRHPDVAKERRNIALARMLEVGFADAESVAKAKAAPLVVHAGAGGRRAPWAVDLAVEAVESARGEGAIAREALDVHTAIDPALQRLGERAVREGLAEVVAAHPKAAGAHAALVAVRASDGAIVALVGGDDYGESPFDRATFAERQIGSTIKPLTMLAAFATDPSISPATRFEDAPLTRVHDGKEWVPANYDGVFVGPISLRAAIAQSRNVPAVLLAERVGMGELKRRWRALGLSGATDYPSAALGGFGATPTQLAGAYAVLVDGTWRAPWVVRAASREGEAVWSAPTSKGERLYDAGAAWLARDVMRSVMTDGTGRSAAKYGVGPGAAGKTGTTDGNVDAWFAGVAGPYAVVAWVGFDRDKPLGLTGGQAALPVWARFVAGTGADGGASAVPAGVVAVEVCVATDLPACDDCAERRTEHFFEGHVPDATCGVVEEVGEAVKTGWEKIGEMFGIGKRD
ncbi:MAG: transglycosylase domain-containing protein [Myxococcota bacterium]